MNTSAALTAPAAAAPTLTESLRELPRSFWINWTGVFLNRFGHFVLPFLSVWVTGRGWTERDAAWAAGAFSAGALFAGPIGGWMADHLGRRRTMTLSLVGGASVLLLLGASVTLWQLLLACFAYGLVGNCLGPASQAFIADVVPQVHRMAAYTAHRMAINLGFALGPVVAGFVIERSPWALFVADASTSFVYAGIVLLLLPETRAVSGSPAQGWRPALRTAWRDPAFVTFLLAVLLVAVVFRQFNSTLPLQVKAAHGTPAHIGLIYGLNGLIIIVAEMWLAQVTRHWRMRRAMALGTLVIGLGFGLNALGPSVALAAFSMAVLTGGEMMAFSRTSTYSMSRAPEAMRGRFSGLLTLSWSGGEVLGALVGLHVFGRSPTALWLGCVAVTALAAALLAWHPRSARAG